MKDPKGKPVQGRTKWRRFAAMMVPSAALAGAVVFGMSNGAIAASFAVSGQVFKVTADRLEGESFAQFGGVVVEKDGGETHPVAASGFKKAKLWNLCQSVDFTGAIPLPGLNELEIVLTIHAGGDAPVEATDMLIDLEELSGNAEFRNIQIGRDASDLTQGPPGGSPIRLPGTFAQQADSVVITDLKQTGRSITAGTFNLKGLKLAVNSGDGAQDKQCF